MGHCDYHRYLTKLYVGGVQLCIGGSSELGLYQTYTCAYLFDTLVAGLPWVTPIGYMAIWLYGL